MTINNLSVKYANMQISALARCFRTMLIPAFFNGDRDGVLERARLTTSNGELKPGFS
jgi:hypothetical protein